MIFNFTRKFQFTTDLSVNDKKIEIVKETKLLGTHITDDLKWDKNTSEIVKKANRRMQLLTKAASFTLNRQDLKRIYLTYIRSILDQSAVVWHSSLSQKNKRDLERVQKVAVRIIVGKNYTNYKENLLELNLKNLNVRRENIYLNVAKKCLKNDKVKNIFPKRINLHKMKKRSQESYKINMAKTKRYKKSAIPYMARILNIDNMRKEKNMNGLY